MDTDENVHSDDVSVCAFIATSVAYCETRLSIENSVLTPDGASARNVSSSDWVWQECAMDRLV